MLVRLLRLEFERTFMSSPLGPFFSVVVGGIKYIFSVADKKPKLGIKNGRQHKEVISSLSSCQVALLFQNKARVFSRTKDKDRFKKSFLNMNIFIFRETRRRDVAARHISFSRCKSSIFINTYILVDPIIREKKIELIPELAKLKKESFRSPCN